MPDSFWYAAKRRLLGAPLVNEQLKTERLSKPLALGILSCDGISSAAYGTEMMLLVLLPFFGLAAFTLILPLTLVILVGIFLVMLSYREVVSVYTRAGGSYVVARENFGPRVAQVAAVALMIDYVVTLAVQTAAGSAAIVSAFPGLSTIPVIGPKILLVISAAAILLMCFGNLRGIREAGHAFALPTYLFSGSVVLMIVMGLYREVVGGRALHVAAGSGAVAPGSHAHTGLIVFGAIYILARSFANGGSSLTGIEAVSNAVGALQPPEGRNAREILVAQGSIVAFLIAGISWLAHDHARDAVHGRSPDGAGPGGQGDLWVVRSVRSCSSPCKPVPPRFCSPAGTPASAGSRSWPALSPRTGSCRGGSANEVIGWCSPTESSS